MDYLRFCGKGKILDDKLLEMIGNCMIIGTSKLNLLTGIPALEKDVVESLMAMCFAFHLQKIKNI